MEENLDENDINDNLLTMDYIYEYVFKKYEQKKLEYAKKNKLITKTENKYKRVEQDKKIYLSEFPKEFINLFSDKYKNKIYRHYVVDEYYFGENANTYKKINISFLYSLFMYIYGDLNFVNNNLDELIKKLKESLISTVDSTGFSFYTKYKFKSYGIQRSTIINAINNNEYSNIYVIYYIINFFNYNLIVFDFIDKKVDFYYTGVDYKNYNYNPYKPTILMSKINNIYEPMFMSHKKRYWDGNWHAIRNIFENKEICRNNVLIKKKDNITKLKVKFEIHNPYYYKTTEILNKNRVVSNINTKKN